jgi:hypothetical protein
VATLNSIDGRVKSSAAIVPAGANGAVSMFATDTTDVILDINGYFVAGSNASALAFYPLALYGPGFCLQRHGCSARSFGLHHYVAAGTDPAAGCDAERH